MLVESYIPDFDADGLIKGMISGLCLAICSLYDPETHSCVLADPEMIGKSPMVALQLTQHRPVLGALPPQDLIEKCPAGLEISPQGEVIIE